MRHLSKIIIIALFAVSLFVVCFQKGTDIKTDVIGVTLAPIADITARIAGEEARVVTLMPPGANPHTYSPVPSDIAKIQNAALILAVQPDFDGWIQSVSSSRSRLIFIHSDNGHDHSECGHDHSHEHCDNPHIWLSVRQMRGIIPVILNALVEAFPQEKEGFMQRAEEYMRELGELDNQISEMLAPVKGKSFIQWHSAWDVFAEDYGLRIAGTIEQGHGDEPSVREFRDLVLAARNDNVRVIVVGLGVESRAAKRLAQETGAEIIQLDALGSSDDPEKRSYANLMLHNADLLRNALTRE